MLYLYSYKVKPSHNISKWLEELAIAGDVKDISPRVGSMNQNRRLFLLTMLTIACHLFLYFITNIHTNDQKKEKKTGKIRHELTKSQFPDGYAGVYIKIGYLYGQDPL